MGRLVYVSFLGTNNYVAARYKLKDKISPITKFVQFAETKFYKDKIDEYILFISEEAYQNNWKDNKGYRYIEDFKDGYKGLEYILTENLKIEKEKIKVINIENILHPDGKKLNTQNFVYSLFNEIVNNIENNSELIVDITHSFRSIPFVSFTAFRYLAHTKNIKIKNIFYGAFEDLGSTNEVIKNIKIEDRIIEIIDLKSLLFLDEWASGVEDYDLYGRFTKLKELTDDEDMRKLFNNFEEIFLLGNGKEMFYGKKILELKDKISKTNIIEEPSLKQVVEDLKGKIIDDLSKYNENDLKNILNGIEFLIEKKQLIQVTTLIMEFIYSYLCRKYSNSEKGKNKCETNYYKRDIYQKAAWIIASGHERNEEKWSVDKDTVKEKIRNLLNKITKQEKKIIKDLYNKINKLRNSLNHGGFKEIDINIDELQKKLNTALNSLKNLLENNDV